MRTGESRRGTDKYSQRCRGGARATGWVAARRSRTIDAGSETRQTDLFGHLCALSRAAISETVSGDETELPISPAGLADTIFNIADIAVDVHAIRLLLEDEGEEEAEQERDR